MLFRFYFYFPEFCFHQQAFFLTNDCGGGVFSSFFYLSVYLSIISYPFFIVEFALLLVSAFLTFILAGLVFGFFFPYILRLGLRLGIGLIYMIIPFFLYCHSIFVCFV